MTQSLDDLDHTREPSDEELDAKKVFSLLSYRLRHLPATARANLQSRFAQLLVDETFAVETPNGSLSFVLLGRTAASRALSLLTRQPATIEWIDAFRPDSVFWDVGANVGAYTLYAALRGDTRVVAFEPAAVNYFLLTANCEANNLDDRINCLLLGLGRNKAIARLEVSQFAPAKSFSFHGKHDRPHTGRQAALVLSMDQLIEEYELACPNYIKIDVPGVTEAIVAGGEQTLRRPEVRELHIEFTEHSTIGLRIVDMLKGHGFVITSRHGHGTSTDLTLARPGS